MRIWEKFKENRDFQDSNMIQLFKGHADKTPRWLQSQLDLAYYQIIKVVNNTTAVLNGIWLELLEKSSNRMPPFASLLPVFVFRTWNPVIWLWMKTAS